MLPASLLHRQREPWTAGRRNGDPRAIGQDRAGASPAQPEGLLTNAPASQSSCPQGYSQTEGSRVPISMTTTVPNGCPPQPGIQQGPREDHPPQVKTRCGGMAFPVSCSESQAMGLQPSVLPRGSWKLSEAGAQSRLPEGSSALNHPGSKGWGPCRTGTQDPGPALSR